MKAKFICNVIIGLLCAGVGTGAMAQCSWGSISVAVILDKGKYSAFTEGHLKAQYANQPAVDMVKKGKGEQNILYFNIPACPESGRLTLATANEPQPVEAVTFDFKLNPKNQTYSFTCPFGCTYDRCCATTSKAGNLAFGVGDKFTGVCKGVPLCTQ